MTPAIERRNGSGEPRGAGSPLGLRNLASFLRAPLRFLEREVERGGDVAEITMAGRRWLLVSHPADIESVLLRAQQDTMRDAYAVVLRRALGLGLLTSEGDHWRRQRKLASTAFTPKRIRTYEETMVAVTARGLDRWRDGQQIGLHTEMSQLTLEVVAEVLLGAAVSEHDVESVRGAMEVINEYFAASLEAVLQVPEWVPSPGNLRMNRALGQIDALIFRIIESGRRSLAAGEERRDLLAALLAARGDDGTGMDDRQLRDETITMFLAGHETTALALAHTLYLLSKHPDVERRLHQELESVLGGRAPAQGDVERLVYTRRVIEETMRLYPPAWMTGREIARPFEVAGRAMKVGEQILMPQWVVHRDPRWWPNPEAFEPDRFTPEAIKSRPRFAYFPFGGGARVCIGNHFAMMEAVLMLAVIAQRFRIELLPHESLELAPSVTLRPKGRGLRARIVERTRAPAARTASRDASI